jgi:hypothetical protein
MSAVGQLQGGSQKAEREPRRILRRRVQVEGVAGDRLRDDLAVAVEHRAPGRGYRDDPHPVVLRPENEVVVADDLRAEEGGSEEHEYGRDQQRGDDRPSLA